MQQAASNTAPKFSEEQLKTLSGVLGAQIGSGFQGAQQAKVNLDFNSFVTAVTDSVEGKKTQMTLEQAGQTLQAVEDSYTQQELEKGQAFLKENGSKEGVKTTASGLQYKITKEGTGKQPKATDKVSISYVGKLIDGTEFDNSQGKPVSFALNQVIPGWTEGIQLLKEGSEATLYIPSELAYGKNPPPQSKIMPNSVLVFDVKLEKVGK
ncbi:MAG: FKBP-type peptidyl-prolyl cis-trans isomerase [Neisseria sp.]|nr:FKBP-type peptidyl-prolyl cis-trans isomerase [Neisseria sp.]MDO4641168.1 FKBP-type peptidyl-prolyl cis-trans isomerase [Neisseria sp.]